MSYRDILVHLDGGDRDPQRIAVGASLVRRFGGRLTGLFARQERYAPSIVAQRASEAFEAAAAESEKQFTAMAAGLPARFWRLSHGEAGHVLAEVSVCARLADLVVLGQHHDGKAAPPELAERVVLESGRPCLIVPAVGEYPVVGDAVMIAWNGGRESTRALHDSLPFLEVASSVEVVSVRQHPNSGTGVPVPPLSILDHLATHGIRVNREVLAAEDIGIMDLLLSRACDQGSDLLVMGAHSTKTLPFRKGAGTRYVLEHMTLPVLMSH